MGTRAIVHLDADAFFASVEQAADPRLRGKPVAVGGEKRGIIASASYEARHFGVYTPMPTVRARQLCPKLIVLPGDFEKYERFSRWMFSYAYDFTPDVEIGSIDEGYFDLTSRRGGAVEIAATIRKAIAQALKISVSEGVGSNKLVSQIASKLNKPDSFLTVAPGRETSFLFPLPNRWLPGVGPKTSQRLNVAGLARISQIAHTPPELLHLVVGNIAPRLREFARGEDERPVVAACTPAKSYGHQETFSVDQTNEEFLEAVLRGMTDRLMAAIRDDGKTIRTVTVKVRYNDMAEDQAAESLDEPTDLESDVYALTSVLLRRAWRRRVSLRLVAVKFSNVYERAYPLELALDHQAPQQEARRRLARTVDALRGQLREGVLLRGHDFTLREKHPRTQRQSQPDLKADPAAQIALKPRSEPGAIPEVLREEIVAYKARRVERQKLANKLAFAPGRNVQLEKPPPFHVKPAPQKAVRPYVPLELHSYYSILDSTLTVEAIVARAVSEGWPAVAIADTGNLHAAVTCFQAAQQAGLRAVVGATIVVEGQKLRLFAQNKTGYQNLCRLLSQNAPPRENEKILASRGEEAIPSPSAVRSRCDVEECSAGLIAVGDNPGLGGVFPGRFYLGISSCEQWRKLGSNAGGPMVACLPVHYENPSDRWKYDVLQSIRTLTLLRQGHPEKKTGGAFHLRTAPELAKMFALAPDLVERTCELAERCEFVMELGRPQFPSFVPPDGSTPSQFLRELVFAGAQRRYPGNARAMSAQLEVELAIIREVGYEEYFLVMWDLLQDCRRRDIEWITRGSAADSLVCYCLEISDVCPVRFELYFRRFLNKERMALHKLPDIDVDFAHDRKDDVLDLIFEKYGSAHTAAVGGFSTYRGRGALGDVAKVLGVSEHQIRRITERLAAVSAHELAVEALTNKECADLPLREEPYRSALQMAQFLSGFPRYAKMHPCGVVLSRQPMCELVPTFVSHKGYPTTHFDMDAVEAIGLVKMDILAQGGLAVMRDVKKGLARAGNPGPAGSLPNGGGMASSPDDSKVECPGTSDPRSVDLHGLAPWQDPAVWEMIADGGARAVHHIESPAMISLCRMCNVRDIDTLIAIVSVIRPGAANENNKTEFARRCQGISPTVYPHASLTACLRSSFGLVVYEEHILQICEAFAGLPAGRADVLRRALAKGRQGIVDEIGQEFASSARALGRLEEDVARVWELVSGFSGYAFCKAHSTAYGVEAYEAAWLKRYYPAEFMAAVLSHGKGFYNPLVYVLECHRLGIVLLPPSVREPGPAFVVQPRPDGGTGIRVPATRVKGLTSSTQERMVAGSCAVPFEDLEDFYRRVHPLPDEVELLLRSGAFDVFGKSRTAQFWECQLLQRVHGERGQAGQGWLFPPPGLDRLPEVLLEEPTWQQRLEWEAELLGFPASGHPLDLHRNVAWESYCPVSRLGGLVGELVVTCGLVIEQRVHHQVTGEPMKFLTLADWTGMVETELFASTYRSYGLATVRYPVLEVTATVEPFENGRGISLRVLRAGKPRLRQPGG